MQDLPERVSVNLLRHHRDWRLNRDETQLSQVPEENADHPEREVDVGGNIYHCGGSLHELQDRKVLRSEPARVPDPGLGGGHGGD
jgi:hypothetical protein